MNILITGGAGFIGLNLYKQLKERGHEVTIIDNYSTSNKIDAVTNKDVYKLDLSNEKKLPLIDMLVKSADIVYHFASSIGVAYIDKNPSSTLQNSFSINNILFPLFEKYQPKVIYASTSEVYGSKSTPAKETDDLVIGCPTTARWGYACSKLMSEFLIKSYTFNYTIVRFFNVTGKGQLPNYGMVMPKFVNAAMKNEDITIYGDGQQIRSFCDIRDAVNVLERLLTEQEDEILNIGALNITTIMSLAHQVIQETNSSSKIILKPFEDEFKNSKDIDFRIPDLSKQREFYKTQYDIADIIRSMKG